MTRYIIQWRSKDGTMGHGTRTWTLEESELMLIALDTLSLNTIKHWHVEVPTNELYWTGEIPNLESKVL